VPSDRADTRAREATEKIELLNGVFAPIACYHRPSSLGVPIDRYRVGGPGLRDLGGFIEGYGLGQDGAVLVRPDGHVAWRSATGPAIDAVLRDAVETILAR
jgi:hypothetical protein